MFDTLTVDGRCACRNFNHQKITFLENDVTVCLYINEHYL
jgi:hypothetical protein